MFELKKYSSNIQMILGPHEGGQWFMPLAPSEPRRGPGLALLISAPTRSLFSDVRIVSKEYAECVKSALLLYFSALEQSHEISQGISSATGSFLHGIMHRQEPDFGNAKYWFRRVPSHDVYPALQAASLELLGSQSSAAAQLLKGDVGANAQWDPCWFIDQCEAAHGGDNKDFEQRLLEIQRLEWQLLFDHCFCKATSKD